MLLQWPALSSPKSAGRVRLALFYVAVVIVAMALGKYSIAPAISRHWRVLVDSQEHSCLPFRVAILRVGRPDNVARGDYVAFISHGRVGMGIDAMLAEKPGRRVIVKKVLGVPGDILTVENDQAFIGGRFVGDLDLLRRLGKPSGSFDRKETIGESHYALFGTLPRSYDSRYWGTVPHEELVGVVYPLL